MAEKCCIFIGRIKKLGWYDYEEGTNVPASWLPRVSLKDDVDHLAKVSFDRDEIRGWIRNMKERHMEEWDDADVDIPTPEDLARYGVDGGVFSSTITEMCEGDPRLSEILFKE